MGKSNEDDSFLTQGFACFQQSWNPVSKLPVHWIWLSLKWVNYIRHFHHHIFCFFTQGELWIDISVGVFWSPFSSFKGREIGNEKLIGILDLQQITFKNVDASGLITGFQFLQVILSLSLFRFLKHGNLVHGTWDVWHKSNAWESRDQKLMIANCSLNFWRIILGTSI